MTTLAAPPEPPTRSRRRGDTGAILRLAQRTQRGQGKRRALVAALIAVSVMLGVVTAIVTTSQEEADLAAGTINVFGNDAVAVTTAGVFDHDGPTTSAQLTPEQQEWLAAHPSSGSSDDTPADPLDDIALTPDLERAIGWRPVTVAPEEVIEQAGIADDDALAFRAAGLLWSEIEDYQVLMTDMDTTHPLAAGTFDTGGRAQALTGDQALLSPSLLTRLGAEVGDRVDVSGVGEVEVVGTATQATSRSTAVAIVAPGRSFGSSFGVDEIVRLRDAETADRYREAAGAVAAASIDALPRPTPEQIAALDEQDYLIDGDFSPYTDGTDPAFRGTHEAPGVAVSGFGPIIGTTVGALMTSLAAILGACAFAVGVRRRIREIGMLGAIGASPRQLRRLLRREGLIIGIGGALAGAVLSILVAPAVLALLERAEDSSIPLVVPASGVVVPVIVGALGAVVAAAWPARTAARVPVVTALAGRVPLGRVPRWLPVVGAVAAGIGVVMLAQLAVSDGPDDALLQSLQLLVSVLLATLGTASLGLPVIAAGESIADRLPFLGRLAVRDAARQRSRSAAAIAALVPVMAIPAAALTVAWTERATLTDATTLVDVGDGQRVEHLGFAEPGPSRFASIDGPYVDDRQVPPSDRFVDEIESVFPPVTGRADAVTVGRTDAAGDGAWLTLGYDPDGRLTTDRDATQRSLDRFGSAADIAQLTLATPELLDVLGLAPDAVPDDGVLWLTAAAFSQVPPDLDLARVPVTAGGRVLGTVPVAQDTTVEGHFGVEVLIAPGAADDLGLDEVGRSVVLGMQRPPSDAERIATFEIGYDSATGLDHGFVETSPTPTFWASSQGLRAIVALVVLTVVLIVTVVAGMTSVLAATESDADVRKAVALGAEPSLRRRLHGVQAWWHTVIASVLGAGLGVAICAAVFSAVESVAVDATGATATIPDVAVPWVPMAAWIVLVPVIVGLVIAGVMRSAPVGAPRRRTA